MFKRILIYSFFLLLAIISSKAQGIDATDKGYQIISIVKLNEDAIQDTIIGVFNQFNRVIPKYILWGRNSDTVKQMTTINYYKWNDLNTSYLIERLNQDSIYDVLILNWGKTYTSNRNYVDSCSIVAIFGGNRLDTNTVISLDSIGDFQYSPCLAMKYRLNKEIDVPAIRDLTKIKSYIIEKTYTPENNMRIATLPTEEESHEPVETKTSITVFPNPINGIANIDLENIKNGIYHFELFNTNSVKIKDKFIDFQETDSALEELDLGQVPNGFYLLNIYHDNELIVSYKLIVFH